MHILVVDDDSVVLDLISEQLEGHDLTAILVHGVDEALKAMKHELPRLVLTDVRMGPRDGYALLAEVLRSYPEVPVVLMSSFSPAGSAEAAREAGAAGFLRKPFTEGELVDALSATLPNP